MFTARVLNPSLEALGKALESPNCLPGLGDAGAHVGQIMDAGWTTFVLAYWHRQVGHYSLAQAVNRITAAPAAILGLRDRGVLRVGNKADLNVIALAELNSLLGSNEINALVSIGDEPKRMEDVYKLIEVADDKNDPREGASIAQRFIDNKKILIIPDFGEGFDILPKKPI